MVDFVEQIPSEITDIELRSVAKDFFIEESAAISGEQTSQVESALGDAISTSATLTEENLVNLKRLESLEHKFSRELITIIRDEYFEYGIETKADVLVRHQMELNTLATMTWLNGLFVEHFNHPEILVGILRMIARLDFDDIYPNGVTMAVAALRHSDIGVQDCGIRAFESWDNFTSLRVLQNISVSEGWLKKYVDQVVQYLHRKYYATTGSEI